MPVTQKQRAYLRILSYLTNELYDIEVKTFEEATGMKVPYKIAPRRAGDIDTCYSDPTKAKNELGWEAERDLRQMCKDSWNYIERKK